MNSYNSSKLLLFFYDIIPTYKYDNNDDNDDYYHYPHLKYQTWHFRIILCESKTSFNQLKQVQSIWKCREMCLWWSFTLCLFCLYISVCLLNCFPNNSFLWLDYFSVCLFLLNRLIMFNVRLHDAYLYLFVVTLFHIRWFYTQQQFFFKTMKVDIIGRRKKEIEIMEKRHG